MSYKIRKLVLVFEDNDFEYQIPISKLEKFSSPETIEELKKAAIEAIRRM